MPAKETTMPDGRLWCMHIEGPDDVHAAPDFWTALAWAAELNACIAKRAAQQNWVADDNYPLTQAVVAPWPYDHATFALSLNEEMTKRLGTAPSLIRETTR